MKKIFLTALLLTLPANASAATLTLTRAPSSVGAGDTVLVTLSVESDESVNAFSGALRYSSALTPVSVTDGGSAVSLWVTPPAQKGSEIPFAGITTSGMAGEGKLFSVLFRALPGEGIVSVADPQVLLNDGQGTAAPLSAAPLMFDIGRAPLGGYVAPSDTVPPESFMPMLEKGPDGLFYLDFATTDKGSGVARYEVAEQRPLWPFGRTISFSAASSPYLLHDQYLTSDIVVRASDAQGNVRTQSYPHTHLLRPYEEAALVGMLILIGALAWGIVYRRASKRNENAHTT